MKKTRGILLDMEGERAHAICSFMWAGNFWIMSHSKEMLKQMLRDLLKKQADGTLEPSPASLWWTSTYDSEEKCDMIFGHIDGMFKFKILKSFDAVEERMHSADKAFWKDLQKYKSKDVPWKIKCQRLVDHIYAVFAFRE